MASPNQPQPPFDMHKFFMPTTSPSSPPAPPLFAPPPQQPPPSSSYPPPSTPHLHHHFPFPYSPPQHSNPNPNLHPQRSLSYPTPPLQPPHQERSGAEIMALLRPPSQDPPPLSLPDASPNAAGPIRMPTSKMPKGRRVSGDHIIYDIDVRLQGEVQPQLEVTPITKYSSDPQLCLGRQIAVNKSYICYGLKQGNIRILNINTALRSLFRTQSQRVTDMAFFAEDVHLLASAGVDGRINVWKISEGPDDEDKPQITGKTIFALQILGEDEVNHPRVCWHCYKQEILVVSVGKRVLRIDTNKIGKGDTSSAELPIQCPVDRLIEGIQFVGMHDGEVTDLSMCQWMTTRLVSASMDGTIKIWEDLRASPLLVLRPHDNHPVYSAIFLTATDRPDHIILVTMGPQNREMKIWASASKEGYLLPNDTHSLNCTQTLELKSSVEPRAEEAFFNQVVALSQVGLVLLANAKRNAIYAVHLDYGPNPAATCLDYISEFTVTMPILSLTGTSDVLHGQCIAQIYCVQTQAIQQYTLELCQCLPPLLENLGLEKSDFGTSYDIASTEGFPVDEPHGNKFSDASLSSPAVGTVGVGLGQDTSMLNMDAKHLASASSTSDADIVCVPSSSLPLGYRSSKSGDQGLNEPVIDYSADQKVDKIHTNLSDVPSYDGESRNDHKGISDDNDSSILTPVTFKHPTHLITPSEILMGVSSPEVININDAKSEVDRNIQNVAVNGDVAHAEADVKIIAETKSMQNDEFDIGSEPKKVVSENREKFFCSQASGLGIEMAKECCAISSETCPTEEPAQGTGVGATESLAKPCYGGEEEVPDTGKASSAKVSTMPIVVPQSVTPSAKGKKQKGRNSQASGPPPSLSAFNSTDCSSEPVGTSNLLTVEAAFPQIFAIQEVVNQLIITQKDMQKQLANIVAAPVSKECRRLEQALGRNIEKAVKANTDALWTRFQEENTKNEKISRDRFQQITNLISNFFNKELVNMIEKAMKKELASVGPAVVRAISPVIEKVVASVIAESFQRGVSDKAVNQLEKSVCSKLEATVARQIQAQFQTSGKQALQDALRTGLEASVIPAFEMTCKAMFEQVDATFRKGIVEHTAAALQHFDSSYSSLALALRESINSASSLTKTLSGEFAESQRKFLALAAAGANSSATSSLALQLSNGPLAGLHEKVEVNMDPRKDLSRLISEHKFEEAFTIALQRSDVSIVSWLCSQVDFRGIFSTSPLPFSQGVLLSLLQQLACDVNKEPIQKLEWMTDVAAAINPADQMIAVHVGGIVEQVYQILHRRLNSPAITGAELHKSRVVIRLLEHLLADVKRA